MKNLAPTIEGRECSVQIGFPVPDYKGRLNQITKKIDMYQAIGELFHQRQGKRITWDWKVKTIIKYED